MCRSLINEIVTVGKQLWCKGSKTLRDVLFEGNNQLHGRKSNSLHEPAITFSPESECSLTVFTHTVIRWWKIDPLSLIQLAMRNMSHNIPLCTVRSERQRLCSSLFDHWFSFWAGSPWSGHGRNLIHIKSRNVAEPVQGFYYYSINSRKRHFSGHNPQLALLLSPVLLLWSSPILLIFYSNLQRITLTSCFLWHTVLFSILILKYIFFPVLLGSITLNWM